MKDYHHDFDFICSQFDAFSEDEDSIENRILSLTSMHIGGIDLRIIKL